MTRAANLSKLVTDANLEGTLDVTGVVTANAGVVVDNITIDGTEIDLSSGNLTIDVAGQLVINSDSGQVVLQDDTVNWGNLQNSSGDFVIEALGTDKDIIFKGLDGGSVIEAGRFNMSDRGAFYVGQTNTTILGNGGFAVKPQDDNNNVRVDIGADNQAILASTEQSTGAIISLYKEATAIGHIGVHDSDGFFFTRGATNQGIVLKNSALMPCNTDGSNSDADQDIGTSSVRWKDLYLSSGVFLGGTGSANELDDYEEGTWTPSLVGLSNSPSFHNNTGRYTKIGRVCTAQFFQQTNVSPTFSTGTNAFKIGGLPFSVDGSGYTGSQGTVSAQGFHYIASNNNQSVGGGTGGASLSASVNTSEQMQFQVTNSGGTRGEVNNNGAAQGYIIEATVTYFTSD